MSDASLTPHSDPEVIVFNLKRRYTGVSATVNALVPIQAQQWRLAYCGTPLPHGMPGMRLKQAIRLSRRPPEGRAFRIWHVRRDHEMMAGIFARDVLRLPIKLVFTSAAQHLHGWFPRWLISRMDAVISTTPLAASFVPNTTAVVAHGIDMARFPKVDKRQAWADSGLPGTWGIGTFGRVRPDKGSDVFVEAMLRVLPEFPQFSAVIAGLAQPKDADFQKRLQMRIGEAGLSKRLVFLGEVPAAEVHQWYQRCLIAVACPRYEPFGLTPFEAASTGCAVIGTRTGAFDQLAEDGVTGALVDVDDVNGLANALRDLMVDPERTLLMGEHAHDRVEDHFTVAHEAAGIAAVYQGLFDQVQAG